MKILIADTISHNRDNLASFLSESGMKVVGTAASGEETLTLAKVLKPDLIILDINLPDVDVQETISSLKNSQPTVEVILLVVSHNRAVQQQALDAGAFACLAKNEGVDPLLDAIQKSQKTRIEGEQNE